MMHQPPGKDHSLNSKSITEPFDRRRILEPQTWSLTASSFHAPEVLAAGMPCEDPFSPGVRVGHPANENAFVQMFSLHKHSVSASLTEILTNEENV
jgi:hypothetical protein